METETRTAASQLGVSQRQVQRMARAGRLAHREVAGRTVVSGRAVLAASRSRGRGRSWDQQTVRAACDLLESGSTSAISGSQRSRLRARLRDLSTAELAYHVLGLRVSLWRSTAASADTIGDGDQSLTSTGATLRVAVTPNANTLARQWRLIEDVDGETVLVELETSAEAVVSDIVVYAYGDERSSNAARERLRERQEKLR